MVIQGDNMSQAEFIRAIQKRDTRNIFRAQQLIVSERIYVTGKELKATKRKKGIQRRSGRLEESVTNPDFIIQSLGEQFNMILDYPLHIRFLDMRHKGNWRIYRHPIWGIIYNQTVPDIKYRSKQEVKDSAGNALRNAFEKYDK